MSKAEPLVKRINWRLVWRITWLLVIAGVVYTLLPTLTKMPEQARESLEKVHPYALLIGLGLELVAQLSGMLVLRRSLEALKQRCSVVLYTDSVYVRSGITEWLPV